MSLFKRGIWRATLLLLWTALYYLACAFVAGTFDSTQWDEALKAISLLLLWLPGAFFIVVGRVDGRDWL